MPYIKPVTEVKFTTKINQAERESIRMGMLPKNCPPYKVNSTPCERPAMAIAVVSAAPMAKPTSANNGFSLGETNSRTTTVSKTAIRCISKRNDDNHSAPKPIPVMIFRGNFLSYESAKKQQI